ncbi:condensation domain-containing protein [Actinokineospora sp.]|uniref:condensation domain-containing protein n=1 Tax=Actinokineospora sp. TaxID=1872133 RepID=UPI0040377A37
MIFGLRIHGDVDETLLGRALTAIVRRHSALRYFFPDRDVVDFALCAAADSVSCPLDVVDLSSSGPGHREAHENNALDKLRHPFELSVPPLARALLIRHPEYCTLGIAIDHIIFDGASIPVFLRDLETVWRQLSTGDDLPDTEVSDFAAFAAAEHEWLRGARADAAFEYWRPRWAELGPTPRLPLRHVVGKPAASGTWNREISADTLADKCARLGSLTPFTLISTALFTAFHQVTGEVDLGLILPISRRNNVRTRQGIGYYNNPLLLRVELTRGMTLDAAAGVVREATLGALRHSYAPFQAIKDRFAHLELPAPGPYLYLNMMPPQRAPQLPGLGCEFTWFDQEDVLIKFPRLSIICQTQDDGSLLLDSGHNGTHFDWPDVAAVLNRAYDLLVDQGVE